MKYIVFAFGLGLISTSCMDSTEYGHEYRPLTCHDFRTCGSCTPVIGCGWCQIGDDGVCVSDPIECTVARSFTFNWEPAECPGNASSADGGGDAAPDGGAGGG